MPSKPTIPYPGVKVGERGTGNWYSTWIYWTTQRHTGSPSLSFSTSHTPVFSSSVCTHALQDQSFMSEVDIPIHLKGVHTYTHIHHEVGTTALHSRRRRKKQHTYKPSPTPVNIFSHTYTVISANTLFIMSHLVSTELLWNYC